MLGGQLRERVGELGPACRQPREHRAFFVEEVPAHRALEVADRIEDARDVARIGPAGGEPARGREQLLHHVIVTAVAAVELSEACELHGRHI